MNPTLENNLIALGTRSTDLVTRICQPVSNEHVLERSSNELCYILNQSPYPLMLPPFLATVPAVFPHQNQIFLAGIGAGEQLRYCIEHFETKISLIAWERDPWMLRIALSRNDFSPALRTGQLQLRLGVDLLSELSSRPERATVFHPLLKTYYPDHVQLIKYPPQGPTVLLGSGGLFFHDVADAFREKGYSVYPWDTHLLSKYELRRTLKTLQPDLIASINYQEGIAELAEETETPLLCWEIDPVTTLPPPLPIPSQQTHVFTYRKHNVTEFQRAGLQNSTYLPLGTNPKRRLPLQLDLTQLKRYHAPISFVGTSMVEQAGLYRRQFLTLAQNHQVVGAAGKLDAMLAIQRKNFTTFQIPDLMETFFPGLCDATAGTLNLHTLLGEIAGAEKRFAYIAGLSEFNIHIWGDPNWRGAERLGARYRGTAGHFNELTTIYCASTLNLDIGRIYQSDIITMRVFDVLSCGGFLLTEESPHLTDYFTPGEELETYRDLHELRVKTLHYLQHPEEAARIGARGRERVQRDHTISKRVQFMLDSLQAP